MSVWSRMANVVRGDGVSRAMEAGRAFGCTLRREESRDLRGGHRRPGAAALPGHRPRFRVEV